MQIAAGASRAALWLLVAVFGAGPLLPRAYASGPPYLIVSEYAVGASRLTDLIIDASGNAIVSGVVTSYFFTGIDSAKYTNAGRGRRFVAKYPPLSRTPMFVAVVGLPAPDVESGLFDDFGEDEAAGLALDASGNTYLVAYEAVNDYPVTGGTFKEPTGKRYIYKVSAAGVVSRLSMNLDPAVKRVGAIGLDASGNIFLTGSAKEGLQTTGGAPYPAGSTAAGCVAPYVLKFDPSGQNVLYSTYLGLSGTGGQLCGGNIPGQKIYSVNIHPTGFGMAVDAAGNAYVTGQAEPGLAATPGALDLGTKVTSYGGWNNTVQDPALHAFVTKLSPSGSIIYTARIGGSFRDRATSILVDGSGRALIAGKTVSTDFPRLGNAFPSFPMVTMDCLLWTPEVGFLTKLSADGKQLVFSGYVALDGDQLDECQGGAQSFNPARIATDSNGNIFVAGYTTPSNRYFRSSPDSIIPDQSDWGGQLLQIYTSDASQRLYTTALPSYGVTGIGIDPWQNVIVASLFSLQRIAPGSMPVEMTVSTTPGCANQPLTLNATVAGSIDQGSVDFSSDGVSVGSAPLINGVATRPVVITTAGVRKLKATYHGVGPFDGYASPDLNFPLNQAGACP